MSDLTKEVLKGILDEVSEKGCSDSPNLTRCRLKNFRAVEEEPYVYSRWSGDTYEKEKIFLNEDSLIIILGDPAANVCYNTRSICKMNLKYSDININTKIVKRSDELNDLILLYLDTKESSPIYLHMCLGHKGFEKREVS